MGGAVYRATPPGKELSIQCDYAGISTVVLGDVHNVIVVHVESGRANEFCGPDIQMLTLLSKYLDSVVLAVGYQDATSSVYPNVVRQDELARTAARRYARQYRGRQTSGALSGQPVQVGDASYLQLGAAGIGGRQAPQAVHVGDHPLEDVHAAREHGMHAVWANLIDLAWPVELDRPRHHIHNLHELPDLVPLFDD